MNHNIRLSIVMPFYNRELIVEKTINSILANNYTNWELLAVDDGSEETALAYLKNKFSDSRITFIERDRMPKGAQTCRNIGLEKASGKYIVFFDSDDYVAPYCLEQRVHYIESNPKLDFMVFPSGTYVNKKFCKSISDNVYGFQIFSDDIKAFTSKNLPFIVWNNIYKTQSLRNNSIRWDEKLLSLQDADFNLQVLLSGMKYQYASSAIQDYGYTIEERNISISSKITSDTHKLSHLYHLEKNIRTVQKKFSHQYDSSLHQGVLSIYNSVMSDGIDIDFAKKIVAIENKYKMKQYHVFSFQIWLTEILGALLPLKRARQIIMLPYLLSKVLAKKRKISRISKIKKGFLRSKRKSSSIIYSSL